MSKDKQNTVINGGWWSKTFNQYINVLKYRVDVDGKPLIDAHIIDDGVTHQMVFRPCELTWVMM